ncbi:hypothetical protein EYC98_03305 [Halieaceae bacterium IMCC14734]|uniref:HEPN domain-containing protein n=1 Tax=Candidatus Litorirhabdus singularis TaxID=2518993 RepID=A0ABT3TC67_9GAMM|nr:DUF6356 family protein [Candidatus Litorirhabdus singularis]MCX2979887.1 hypothetical protein [Candidatus Litorirhabdus singularis]
MFESSKSHLEEVGEDYFEHQSVAFNYSLRCLKAALMAFVHGLVPGSYETSASELVSSLAEGRK